MRVCLTRRTTLHKSLHLHKLFTEYPFHILSRFIVSLLSSWTNKLSTFHISRNFYQRPSVFDPALKMESVSVVPRSLFRSPAASQEKPAKIRSSFSIDSILSKEEKTPEKDCFSPPLLSQSTDQKCGYFLSGNSNIENLLENAYAAAAHHNLLYSSGPSAYYSTPPADAYNYAANSHVLKVPAQRVSSSAQPQSQQQQQHNQLAPCGGVSPHPALFGIAGHVGPQHHGGQHMSAAAAAAAAYQWMDPTRRLSEFKRLFFP